MFNLFSKSRHRQTNGSVVEKIEYAATMLKILSMLKFPTDRALCWSVTIALLTAQVGFKAQVTEALLASFSGACLTQMRGRGSTDSKEPPT